MSTVNKPIKVNVSAELQTLLASSAKSNHRTIEAEIAFRLEQSYSRQSPVMQRPNDGIDEGITDVLIAEKWLALQKRDIDASEGYSPEEMAEKQQRLHHAMVYLEYKTAAVDELIQNVFINH
jgi:hypothetical protein